MKKTLLCFACLSVFATTPLSIALAESSASDSSAVSSESAAMDPISTSNIDWKKLSEDVQKKAGVKTLTELYTSSNPQSFEKDGQGLVINGYALYEGEDFASNLSIPLGDQTKKGGVLLLDVSYKNSTDKPYFISGGMDINIVGIDRMFTHNSTIALDGNDPLHKIVEQKRYVTKDSEINGVYVVLLPDKVLEKIKAGSALSVATPDILADEKDSVANALIKHEKVVLPLSKSDETKKTEADSFYKDRATTENWGTKTLIEEKAANETKTDDKVEVTLNGYQITEFKPNEDQADKFRDFKGGVVLFTYDFTIKNNGDEAISLGSTSAKMTFDDQFSFMHTNELEIFDASTLVKKGETGQRYVTVAISKDNYELYKAKPLSLSVAVFNEKFVRLTQNDGLLFELKK